MAAYRADTSLPIRLSAVALGSALAVCSGVGAGVASGVGVGVASGVASGVGVGVGVGAGVEVSGVAAVETPGVGDGCWAASEPPQAAMVSSRAAVRVSSRMV